MSPEQYIGFEDYMSVLSLKHTDIWGFGCIMLEFFTGKPPYHNLNGKTLISRQREII